MDHFEVNHSRAEELGGIVSRLGYEPVSFHFPQLFPPLDDFIYTHYVFFMVAIDHRTHGTKRFEGTIDGEFYHGSDLMFYLARRAQKKDPYLFTARRLVDVSEEDVASIFTIGDRVVSNPSQRAALLQDAAKKLLEYHDGDVRNIFESSSGDLTREDGKGILQLLKSFKAYEDPLQKKSFLLVKLLRRQNLLTIKDIHNLKFPVDNVLMTIALQSGLLKVKDKGLERKLLEESLLSDEEVIQLRKATQNAFELVSRASGLGPDILDDLLWTYGREVDSDEGEVDLEAISTVLDGNIDHKLALKDFLSFISGKDRTESDHKLKKPQMPDTWYF
ncbi:MAG: queuosine salvage family protein [Archaeoglobaceae archaeon]